MIVSSSSSGRRRLANCISCFIAQCNSKATASVINNKLDINCYSSSASSSSSSSSKLSLLPSDGDNVSTIKALKRDFTDRPKEYLDKTVQLLIDNANSSDDSSSSSIPVMNYEEVANILYTILKLPYSSNFHSLLSKVADVKYMRPSIFTLFIQCSEKYDMMDKAIDLYYTLCNLQQNKKKESPFDINLLHMRTLLKSLKRQGKVNEGKQIYETYMNIDGNCHSCNAEAILHINTDLITLFCSTDIVKGSEHDLCAYAYDIVKKQISLNGIIPTYTQYSQLVLLTCKNNRLQFRDDLLKDMEAHGLLDDQIMYKSNLYECFYVLNDYEKVISTFNQLQERNITPTASIYKLIFYSYEKIKRIDKGLQLGMKLIKQSISIDAYDHSLYSSIISLLKYDISNRDCIQRADQIVADNSGSYRIDKIETMNTQLVGLLMHKLLNTSVDVPKEYVNQLLYYLVIYSKLDSLFWKPSFKYDKDRYMISWIKHWPLVFTIMSKEGLHRNICILSERLRPYYSHWNIKQGNSLRGTIVSSLIECNRVGDAVVVLKQFLKDIENNSKHIDDDKALYQQKHQLLQALIDKYITKHPSLVTDMEKLLSDCKK